MGTLPNVILSTIRGYFKNMLEKLMFEERSIHLDKNQSTKANGYYERKISSIYGDIDDLQIPRTRDSNFRSELLPKGSIDPSLERLINELYVTGISTRKIEDVLANHFGVSVSHSSIARMSNVAYEEVLKWKNRPLKSYSAVFIDAFYFPLRRNNVQKEAVYVALGITPEGHREVIGFWIPGGSEGSSNWEEIFRDLKSRGVNEIDFIVADGLTGISEAISRVYPNAKYQYCIIHACRSSLNKVRASDKKEIGQSLKEIYFADSKEKAKKALEEFIDKWKRIYPKVTQFWENNFRKLTSFMDLPNKLWRFVYTTNWVERLHKEIKRRIKAMEQFQNEISAERILYSLYTRQNEMYQKTGVNGWKDLFKKYKETSEEKCGKIIAHLG